MHYLLEIRSINPWPEECTHNWLAAVRPFFRLRFHKDSYCTHFFLMHLPFNVARLSLIGVWVVSKLTDSMCLTYLYSTAKSWNFFVHTFNANINQNIHKIHESATISALVQFASHYNAPVTTRHELATWICSGRRGVYAAEANSILEFWVSKVNKASCC